MSGFVIKLGRGKYSEHNFFKKFLKKVLTKSIKYDILIIENKKKKRGKQNDYNGI